MRTAHQVCVRAYRAAPQRCVFQFLRRKDQNSVCGRRMRLIGHPRGPRWGSWAFRFPGLQTAVHIDGTINDDKDTDKGWTVELCFPWKGMEWLAKADNRALPPHEGDVWRIDFSRFNQYKAPPPAQDSGGWFWSRHGIWDSHIPECFPRIRFSTKPAPGG